MVLKSNKTGHRFVEFGYFFILILFSILLVSNAASAVDTGWVAPSSNVGGSGVTSPQNAYADDSSYASFNGGGSSNWNYYGYDFSSIPTGATIDGIEVNALGSRISGSASSRYMRVRLSWNGGTTWTSYSTDTTEWTTSVANHFLGGAADKWGRSWTRDEIANSFRIQAQWMASSTSSDANLDYIPVRVYYTPGAGTTYSVSGIVTNASNSAVISGAAVSVDSIPPQSNTTDVSGSYSFLLSNGTYTIAASKNGYNSNSIPITVNGAPVTNADISLIPMPPGGAQKLLVATNRYVVLDDPVTGSYAGTGFKNPSNSWGTTTNRFNGVETTITVWALLIGNDGMPLANTNVNFTLKNPGGATDYTVSQTTDSNGLVNIARDLDQKFYYGQWQVLADSSGIDSTTSFIYNWWGCGGGAGCSGHGSESVASGAPVNSPYFTGHDTVVGAKSDHQGTNNCMYCHLSYNGQGSTPSMTTSDRHSSFTCNNANCHGSISSHNTNMVIGSCNNCHTRGNITKKSTLNGILSNYSTTSTYHDQNSTIPCVICHGPMHNITKPDPTVGGLNDVTEDTQCTTCHTTYDKHNGGVGCTFCHSQDAHAIKVLSQSGGYVNKGSPYQGNCTNCHQNASYLNTLKSAPKAGSYTGSAPQVQKPLNHSTDRAGTKWDTYWTTTKDACIYCHGDNKHVATRLGNAAVAVGTDPIGGAIGSGTVCASCHNSTDNDYAAIMALLNPDPVAFKPGQNWNTSGTDHASYGTTDADCKSCHGGVLSGSADISEFVHNVDTGKSGGPDCISCHDLSGTAPKKIDVTVLQSSSHNNLNGASTGINKACYACHGDGTAPSSGHPVNYKNPKTCADCHTGTGLYNAPAVIEHNQVGQDVITSSANCNSCHNNSGMFLPNSGTDGMTTAFMHYLKDVTNKGTSPYGHSGPIDTSDCINCHNGPNTSNPDWGSPVNISTSTKRAHTETTTDQCDICHNDGTVSSLANVDFHNASIKLADATDCISCHISATGQGGIYKAINTASFTQHKNVNNTDGGLTNSDCMTCHTDITNMMTTGFTTPTKVCSDCHTGTGVPNAKIIDNHRQNGVNITTGASCATCHNNSVNSSFAYSDNATVSHYTTKTNLIATQDCTNCHKNSVNGTTWGNALDPAGSPSFPHSISNTPTGDCYTCHNSAINFHNITLVKPSVSTVTCLDCHKTTATMAPKKIDSSVIAIGVHKDRACENCHTNATDTNMNNYLFSSDPAKTCTYCHVNSSNLAAPQVAEHNQVGQDAITSNATCTSCHDNSGMYLSNSGTNGTTSAITHYLKDITNRSTTPYQHSGPINTADCIDCHNGPNTSNPNWGNPTNISNSTIRPHTETLTSQCDTCHNDGTVSALANVDFHNKSIKLAPADDCIGCHRNAVGIYAAINTASFTKHENVNTTGGQNNLTNDDCKTCHTDISNMYTSGWTTPTKVCSDCHAGGQYGAKIIDNHKQNGVNISTGASCSLCHNNSVNSSFAYSDNATVSHYTTKTNLIATQDCTNCHKNSVNGTTWGNALDPAASLSFPHSISNTPTGECYTCHNSAINFHNKTLVKPLVSTVTCLDCHKTTATMAPKKIDAAVIATGVHKDRTCENCHAGATNTNMNTYSFTTDPAKTCTYCHTGAGNFSAPLVAEHNQNGQDVRTDASCTTCHNNSGMYLSNGGTNGTTTAITHYLKDVTNTATTPYQHLGSLNTSNCLDCHNGPNTNNSNWGNPVNISTSTKRAHTETQNSDCDLCHNDGTVASFGLVDFHNASIKLADSTDCISCHRSDTGPGGIYKAINIASFTQHKNVNNTDGGLTNSDCTTCHTDITNMMTAGFTTTTKVCSDCHTGTGVPNAIIIDNHRQNGVNISTGASCATCHNNSINSNFAYSDNATVGHYATKTNLIATQDCTNCHKNSVNGTTWGNALDPAGSLSFPHSISNTPTGECYTCHNSAVNFHNITLVKPSVSTVTCLDCHKTTATMAPKKIDATVFGAGVHKNRACTDCHTNATDTNMNTYSFTTDPARTCTYCHTGTGNFGAPLIAEHNQNGQDVITAASCTTCHDNSGMYLSNSGTNGTTTAITHYLKDVTNTATTPYQHFGPIDTSDCIDCHNGPNTSNPNWGNPVNISTSIMRPHTETLTSECNTCHSDGGASLANVDFHNTSVQLGAGGCTGCHSNVGTVSLGLHSNLSGTPAIEDSDCQTCHFGSFPMTTGAANSTNTYYCQDCHTSAGTGSPKPSSLLSVSHGKIDCKWCHAAGDQPTSKYHSDNLGSQQGPKGTATGANCATCHGANLQDLFRAPGITHLGDVNSCGECHSNANKHLVSALNNFASPTLSGISVTTPITVGTPAQIQATLSDSMVMIAAAQYQVTNTSGTVIPWTNMTPLDGFNSATETVIASIPTSNLIGTYTVSIKGMSSAYKTDTSKPYYPLNGMWSSVSTVQLTVNQPKGYVNGTVKNGTNTIAGAIISTNTGVSVITDSNGNYSLNLAYGPYQLITTKEPEYYFNNSVSVTVSGTPVPQNIILNKKPTGNISGTVKNK